MYVGGTVVDPVLCVLLVIYIMLATFFKKNEKTKSTPSTFSFFMFSYVHIYIIRFTFILPSSQKATLLY